MAVIEPVPAPSMLDSSDASIEQPHRAPRHSVHERVTSADPLDGRLFFVVSIMIGVLTLLFVGGLAAQWQSYHAGIQAALSQPAPDHAAVIAYSRALGAAIMKTSALFLGYLLSFIGALYVLRSATAAYQLHVAGSGHSGHLQTSSPGLVIITLGVVLIAIAIFARTDVSYTAPASDDQQPTVSSPVSSDPTFHFKAPPPDPKEKP
jgi:hypothetical protein